MRHWETATHQEVPPFNWLTHDPPAVMQRIIGLGGRSGSGKSAAGDIVESIMRDHNQQTHRLAFADEVKLIARMFGWNGEKDEKGRHLLQVLGTEAGRAYHENIWIRHVQWAIKVLPRTCVIVIDDVRFPNEADFIRDTGIAVCLDRAEPGQTLVGAAATHASETAIAQTTFDHYIGNNGSLGQLRDAIEKILKQGYFIR